jgi:formylglycine-generating enzyme required for sulfatase activity
VEFCNKLSTREGLANVYTISGRSPTTGYPITGAIINADFSRNGYRLPTEAEWQYAAQGGTNTHGYTYAGSNTIADAGWSLANSFYPQSSGIYTTDFSTQPVGGKAANEFGLYDMSGNADEWCWDWYGTYPIGAQTDPTGSGLGNSRVCRGGYYLSGEAACAVTNRGAVSPSTADHFYGFRVARRPPF